MPQVYSNDFITLEQWLQIKECHYKKYLQMILAAI